MFGSWKSRVEDALELPPDVHDWSANWKREHAAARPFAELLETDQALRSLLATTTAGLHISRIPCAERLVRLGILTYHPESQHVQFARTAARRAVAAVLASEQHRTHVQLIRLILEHPEAVAAADAANLYAAECNIKLSKEAKRVADAKAAEADEVAKRIEAMLDLLPNRWYPRAAKV